VEFDREILFDGELRITLDHITSATNDDIKKMIEIKVYNNRKYLMEVMHDIMRSKQIDTQITTHPKIRLFDK
jgi:hypothetical protein